MGNVYLDVRGKSIQSLMNLSQKDLKNLSRNSLSKVVSRLASAGNKRLKRFEKSGIESPSTLHVKEHGGKFSVRGKSSAELTKEFLRVKSFLQSETGTIKGAKQVRKTVISELRKKGVDINESQYDKFFKVYEKLKEIEPSVADRLMKYSVLSDISENLNRDVDDIVNSISKNIVKIYEEQIDDTDFSRFFRIE